MKTSKSRKLNQSFHAAVNLQCLSIQFVQSWVFQVLRGKAFPSLQPASGLSLPLPARGCLPLATLPGMVLATMLPAHVYAADVNAPLGRVDGPVTAFIVRVIDGDTIEADAMPCPDVSIRIRVRLRDIQAPEAGHRAACPEESARAEIATAFLKSQAGPAGRRVFLTDIHPGKYAKRVVADVRAESGADLALALLENGHALSWKTGEPKRGFCPL